MKRFFKIIAITLFTILSIFIIVIFFFSKPISEYALHRAGFAKATVESVSVNLHGITLKNIVLDEKQKIGVVHLFSTLPDLFALRLTQLEVSGPVLEIDPLAGGGSGGNNMAALALLRAATLKDGMVNVVTPWGLLPIHMDGDLSDRGDTLQWTSAVTSEAGFAKLDGQLTAILGKSDGTAKIHFELGEGRLTIPDVEVKRLTGWVSADLAPGKLPLAGAQLSAGIVKAYGVTIQDTTFSLTSAPEKIELLLNGRAPDNAGQIMAEIRTGATPDKGTLDIETHLKTFDVMAKGAFAYDSALHTLSFRTTEQASYTDGRITAKNIQADVKAYLGGPPVLEGSASAGEISTKPALAVPVKATVKFQPLNSLQYGTGFTGEITEANGLLYAKIQGRHDAATGQGEAKFEMPPLTFQKGVTKLEDVFPAAKNYVQDGTGKLGFSAALKWTKTGLTSSGEALLKDFAAASGSTGFSGVNTVLHFDSLMPPVFKNQSIAIGVLDAGLPLTDGQISLGLDKNGLLSVNAMTWNMAKGTISAASPFTLSLDNLTSDATLVAKGLDLVELFKLAPMEGLDATGLVSGTLPLHIKDGNVSITDGVLETEGGGSIRYNPTNVPSFLQDTSKQQIVDLRVALKAFDYESLKLGISGEAGKTQKISLQAKGKNPEFYGGHPVSINFNVEGPLQSVIKYSIGHNEIPDSIRKQIESYEKEHAAQ